MTDQTTMLEPTNGLDLQALKDVVDEIGRNPAAALVSFEVTTHWTGQTGSRSEVEAFVIGGAEVPRHFTIVADEPKELLGANQAPNPQELLMSAVNACMMVGYVAQASVRGIRLTACKITTGGELDLRGFLGLADDVPAGYRKLDYTVQIAGNGSPEQFAEIHQAVMQTSPTYFNMARPINMNGILQVN